MKSYRDEAIVLRTHKLGEADRIITLLTAEHGQVRAVVNEDMEGLALDGRAVEFHAPEVYVDTIAFNAVAWAGNDAGAGARAANHRVGNAECQPIRETPV